MVDEEEDLEDRDEALLDDHNYNVNSGGMVRRLSDEERSGEYGGMSRSSPMASGGKSRHRSSSVGSDPGDESTSPPYDSRAAPRRANSTMAPPLLPSAALANLAMSAPPAEPTHISRLLGDREARNRTDSGRPLGTLDEEVEQRPPGCANLSALEAGSTANPVSISRAHEREDDVGSDEATVSPVSPPPLDLEDELRSESGTEPAGARGLSEPNKAHNESGASHNYHREDPILLLDQAIPPADSSSQHLSVTAANSH